MPVIAAPQPVGATPQPPVSRVATSHRPRAPRIVWASVLALALQAGLVLGGLGIMMWRSLTDYAGSAWLNARLAIDPSNPLRVLPIIALWCVCVLAAGLSGFAATQILRGWGWARWVSLVSAVAAGASALIGPFPALAGIAGLLATALLWTPPARA